MKIAVYNQEGKEAGAAILPKEIFDVSVNPDLLHQVIVSQMAKRRKVIAHTKGRGEVRGGGRKPWRQKGTGRARHGSRRSPIWRGGGVTFGPTNEKVFKKIIPQKMKRKALFMALSAKAKNNLLVLVDKMETKEMKTKAMAQTLRNLPCKNSAALIILPSLDRNVILAARNISGTRTMQVKDINAFDILSFKYLVASKEAIKIIKETFLK